MKELGITIRKILKDWLQSKGENDIIFTDDIAIDSVTDEIVEVYQKKCSELLKQRNKLRVALEQLLYLHHCEQKGIDSEQPTSEERNKAIDFAEAAIKSTER